MTKQQISICPLEKAFKSLEEVLLQEKNEFIRDATIQRFEYTYELSWKMLKRVLKDYYQIKELPTKDIFREGGRLNMISSVEAWFNFLEARNLTSHTYNEYYAEKTYNLAKVFVPECRYLIDALKKVIKSN